MPQVSTLKDVWNRTKENWRNPSGGWRIWMRYHLLDLYSSLSQWITPFFIARMISDFICHLESVMSCDVKCKFKNEKYKSAACGAFVTNITFAAMVLPQKKFVVREKGQFTQYLHCLHHYFNRHHHSSLPFLGPLCRGLRGSTHDSRRDLETLDHHWLENLKHVSSFTKIRTCSFLCQVQCKGVGGIVLLTKWTHLTGESYWLLDYLSAY